jgi:hypothetical protein
LNLTISNSQSESTPSLIGTRLFKFETMLRFSQSLAPRTQVALLLICVQCYHLAMAQEDILEQPAIPARPLQLDDGETDTNLRLRYGIYYMSPELDDILTNHIIYFQCYMSLESDDILNLSYNFTSNRFIRNSVTVISWQLQRARDNCASRHQ